MGTCIVDGAHGYRCLQIATPSRGRIEALATCRAKWSKWSAIVQLVFKAKSTGRRSVYLNKGLSQDGCWRSLCPPAQVRVAFWVDAAEDGMNLVARNIAAQNARSRRAGAVEFAGASQRTRHRAAGQSARHRRHGGTIATAVLDALTRS